MKKINYIKSILLILVVGITTSSCGDFEEVVYDPATDQTFVFFSGSQTNLNVVVDDETTRSVEIEVGVTSISPNARTVEISIDEDLSDAIPNQYTLEGTATIPANEYFGSFTVSGIFENLTTSNVALVVLVTGIDDEGAAFSQESHSILMKRTE